MRPHARRPAARTRPFLRTTRWIVLPALTGLAIACNGDSTGPQVATQIVFTEEPTHGPAGEPFAPQVVVEVRDASGRVVVTYQDPVTIAIAVNPSGGALQGTATVNAVNGVATFPGLGIDAAGLGYRLEATSGALSSQTAAFNLFVPSIYVANLNGGSVSVIDPVSHTVRTTVSIGGTPRSVAVTPDGLRTWRTAPA